MERTLSIIKPDAVAKNVIERMPWEILVNSKGNRFVQEDHESIDHIEHVIGDQPSHRHWAILAQPMLSQMPDMFYDWKNQRIIDESGKQNMFQKADNIRELALKTGLHPLNLESTIERYNNNLTNNKRDELFFNSIN